MISDLESNRIIGQNQADKAIELFNDKSQKMTLSGPIDYRSKFWDISNAVVNRSDGTNVSLCPPAMVSSMTLICRKSLFSTMNCHTWQGYAFGKCCRTRENKILLVLFHFINFGHFTKLLVRQTGLHCQPFSRYVKTDETRDRKTLQDY